MSLSLLTLQLPDAQYGRHASRVYDCGAFRHGEKNKVVEFDECEEKGRGGEGVLIEDPFLAPEWSVQRRCPYSRRLSFRSRARS